MKNKPKQKEYFVARLSHNILLSKAQNSINVNNNYASTTRDCKSYHSSSVKIDNIFTRTTFKSKLCINIISLIRQFNLEKITSQYLYDIYDAQYSHKQLLTACKELVELNVLESNLKQVGKFKHKYEFKVKLNNIDVGYFYAPISIINDKSLTPEALQIILYTMTHNNNFVIKLYNIKKLLGIKSDRHANKHLNIAIKENYLERYFYTKQDGSRETRIRLKDNNNYSIVDNSVDKYVDNFSNEAEINNSTNAKKVTVTFSASNIETNISLRNKKEKNFKKVLNKSIKVSDAIADVSDDLQLEVSKNEVFDPLVELESDNIREAVIVDKDILENALWVNRPYTLANLCNPFSKNGALNESIAFTIRKLSGRKFSNPELHKLICNIQIRYLNKHEKLPVYNNLNNLIVLVIEMIKNEKRKVDDIRTYSDWMPQDLRNAIARSKYEFTEY